MKKRKRLSMYFLVFIMIILSSLIFYVANILLKDKKTVKITNEIGVSAMVKEVLPLTPASTTLISETDMATNTVLLTKRVVPTNDLRGVYLSRMGLTSSILKDNIRQMIEKDQIDAVVIDIKDNTGEDSFGENLRSFVDEMHSKNIYVIGRIAVFQDDKYARDNKSEALKDKRTNALWSNAVSGDKSYWLDPASTSTWAYTLQLASTAYEEYFFDEINLDYIRYPGDGDVNSIVYPYTDLKSSTSVKRDSLNNFYKYITTELRKESPDIKVSADIFGFVAMVGYDHDIGQYLEDIIKYFDYVSPMVYPSHFTSGILDYINPAEHPYEIVKESMSRAINLSTTTQGTSVSKWRPWLQDFDMGARYDENMVRKQIDALESLGIRSYLLWNSANRYHGGAMER